MTGRTQIKSTCSSVSTILPSIKAIQNLVNSKSLDSLVVEGRTFIPISTQYLSFWSGESRMDCESQIDDFWGVAKKEDKKEDKE